MALIYGEACCRGAEQTGSRRNLAKGWRLRGQALLTRGRLEEAEQALRRALAISVELGNPPQLWRTRQALALLYEERGEPERAHAGYRDALEAIERVAARLQDPARRRTFLAAQPVRQIRAGAERTRARMTGGSAPTSRTADDVANRSSRTSRPERSPGF